MSTPRILFVDDEPNVLKALQRAFMDEDVEIVLAENAILALDFLKDNPVDLILSDHNMPELTGVEFLEQCKVLQPEAIRMLITGRGDMDVALQAINQGNIYKYFHKPWDDDELRIAVRHALDYKNNLAQLHEQEEKLARFEAYRQTMITVSHYINNFNCALVMSLDHLRKSPNVNETERSLVKTSFKAAQKISEVVRILNRLQELKIVEREYDFGMIDIEKEVEAATQKIEKIA